LSRLKQHHFCSYIAIENSRPTCTFSN